MPVDAPRAPSVRKTLVLSLLLLSSALALTYSTLFTANRADLAGGYDAHRAIGPQNFYMDFCVHEGHLPLWNPLTLCGMPFAANPVASVYYPFNILRSLLSFDPTPLKTQIGWIVLTAAHLLLMGTGMVFLARSHRLSTAAGYAAAFALIFSAIWVRRAAGYHFVNLVAWVPWLLLIGRCAMLSGSIRRKAWWGCLGALLLGTAMLTGGANIMPYLGVSIALYPALHRLLLWKEGARERLLPTLTGDAVFLVTMLLLGGALAAALFVPGQELASFSSRVEGADYELSSPTYRPPLAEFIGDMIRFPGMRYKAEAIRAAGIGVWMLALLALTSRRWRVSAMYLILFLALFDCSLGRPWPLATFIDIISPIQLYGSNRAFEFALIPLAMLAAIGVDTATDRDRNVGIQLARFAILVFGGYLLYRLLGMLGPRSFLAMDSRVVVIPAALVAILAVADKAPGAIWWRFGIVALLFAETLAWNQRLVPYCILRPNFAFHAGSFDGQVEFWEDNQRGTDHFYNRMLYRMEASMSGYEPVHIARVRGVIASDKRSRRYERRVFDHEVTQENHRGNLFLKRQFWLAREFVRGRLRNKHTLFPPATTVFLEEAPTLPVPEVAPQKVPPSGVSREAVVHWALSKKERARLNQSLARSSSERVISLPKIAMPPQHSVLRIEFRSDRRVTLQPRFSEGDSVRWEYGMQTMRPGGKGGAQQRRIVELPVPDYATLSARIRVQLPASATFIVDRVLIRKDMADEGSLIHILDRGPNNVRLRVGPLEGPRMLVFLDAMYPGWKAYVDGAPSKIYLANDAFKAIALPEGEHLVEFYFRPRSTLVGAVISAAALLICLAGMTLLGARIRPPGTTGSGHDAPPS